MEVDRTSKLPLLKTFMDRERERKREGGVEREQQIQANEPQNRHVMTPNIPQIFTGLAVTHLHLHLVTHFQQALQTNRPINEKTNHVEYFRPLTLAVPSGKVGLL